MEGEAEPDLLLEHPNEVETMSEQHPRSNFCELSKVSCTKFPIFYVDNCHEDCAIQAVVLNYWDNICGPRIHGAWTVNRTPSSDEKSDYVDWDAVSFMGRQILCGEIMKNPSELFLEAKFYDSSEKKIALAAVVFGAIDQGEIKAHSLCLIPNYNQLKRFLQWKDVCFQWLTKCVLQLRITLSTNATTGYTIVKEDLKRLIEIMRNEVHLMEIKVCDTLFSALDDPSVFDFLHHSLVGFLSQGHQAVVIGRSVEDVNKMIKTLMMLTLPHRQHRCALLESKNATFAPELHIQGLYKSEKQIQSLMSSVLFSPQPMACIDCDKKEVFFISWCEDYSAIRQTFLSDEFGQLWSECSNRDVQFGEIFKPVKLPKTSMVHDFLWELSCLPNGLKRPFISNFLKSLSRKALLLSQCLESLRLNIKKSSAVSNNEGDVQASIIRNKLSLTSEWDAHIISSYPYSLPQTYL